MPGNIMDKCIGKFCKVVTKEPGEERAHVVFGMIMDIDYDERFVVIESNPGIVRLGMDTIVAIKPKEQEKTV